LLSRLAGIADAACKARRGRDSRLGQRSFETAYSR
jgi:hypothetical protein